MFKYYIPLIALFFSLFPGSGNLLSEEIDRIFIIVNNDVITYGEFNNTYISYRNELKKYNQPVPKNLKGDLIDKLISNKLITQKAEEKEIDVGEKEIDDALENFKAMNHLTDAMFKEALRSEGKTLKELRDDYKIQIRNQKLMDMEIRSRAKEPSEAEIKKFYNDHLKEMKAPPRIRLSHIQLTENPDLSLNDRLKVKSEMEQLRNRIVKGENFEKLAAKYSDDKISAEKSGDLGEIARGQLAPEMEEAVFALKKNEISQVIKSRYGYHIFKVTEKIPAQVLTVEKARPQIKNVLMNQNMQDEFQRWVDKTKNSAYIEIIFPDRTLIYKNGKWKEKNGNKEYTNQELMNTIK